MDWGRVVDLGRAARNLHLETLGDWYRDPWAWPEITWLSVHPDLVFGSLTAGTTGRVTKLDVPKENFAVRPAMVIEPSDRMAYQALVDVASQSLIGGLRWWVYGWRLKRRNTRSGDYASNSSEWELYRNWLSWLATSHPHALVTDVVSYFASIPTDKVAEDVERTAGGDVGRRIASMLRSWARTPGRSGIPQRSLASSVIANRYLMPLDDELEAISSRSSPGERYSGAVRWMDDIWTFGNDPGELRRGQVALQTALRELDLQMGAAKTMLLEGEELERASRVIEHSAVDVALQESPADLEPLDQLVERLVSAPEAAPRSSVRFATTRIRDKALWQYVEAFAAVAERMPHAADHLARLFRDGGAAHDMGEWFRDYARSPWGCFDWSIGQFGTMFATEAIPPAAVAEYFEEVVASHRAIPIVAVAAQRLSAWMPDRARPLLRDAARTSQDPLERRVLAIALLSAGERRQIVRGLIQEFPENRATAAFLEDRSYRPLAAAGDFA